MCMELVDECYTPNPAPCCLLRMAPKSRVVRGEVRDILGAGPYGRPGRGLDSGPCDPRSLLLMAAVLGGKGPEERGSYSAVRGRAH